MIRFSEFLNEMTVAENMRYAFDQATERGYTLGKEIPLEVIVNAKKQKFMARQDKAGGSKLGVLFFRNLYYGVYLQGDEPSFIIRTFKIDSNNKLTQTDAKSVKEDEAIKFAKLADVNINDLK